MPPEFDIEAIAEQIHDFYRTDAKGALTGRSYKELPEYLKADNRAAARRIGDVLALVGLHLEPCGNAPWSETEQQQILSRIEDNIEVLAEGEHDGWTEARFREGWRLGICKDYVKREHHLLAP